MSSTATSSPLGTTSADPSSSSPFIPSPSTSAGNNPGGSSSSLYLFTFLATVFLLLCISSSIILRAFVVRRRFRRRIEAALAAGVTLTPSQHAVVRDFGEKPRLFELEVGPTRGEKACWDCIQPVSVQMVGMHRKLTRQHPLPSAQHPYPSLFSRLLHRQASYEPHPEEQPLTEESLQVSVLIAMPGDETSAGEVPDVAMGVTQAPVNGHPPATPKES
ncbi:hypothetical protein PLICRDRAFT_180801 [Plicaturopsis crispa FD-325 SS-3]|uniref:Uncharacterized protein n=1 Tax=Plicaturopsis crispa FD-325 SS-3 TaxID=944288 RepID=A0A0C9T1H4_PLICR|nr:hypothetical protein PLICRDRAFT_180801 [Plicaturopsis crispa FD-325 SS-3]